MKSSRRVLVSLVVMSTVVSFFSISAVGQQSNSATAAVPTLVNFSGVLINNGKPLTGVAGVTFSLYAEQQGGAPLWVETQNVQLDPGGRYTVQLGSTTSQGLPSGLFVSGQARWLEVQAQGQVAQPRIMLMSVPYALKAGDAQTVGGLPPSAFVLAAPPNGGSGSTTTGAPTQNPGPANSSDVTTSGGTPGTIPYFSTATDIENSAITQTGSGSSAKIGINNANPTTTLDIKGSGTVRGTFNLPATKTATTTQGYDSQPQKFQASSYSSSTGAAATQNFQWQAEPIGNDTSNPSGTLNLLFAEGSNTPAETGLNIAANGQITFATGQAFPGTGTVTSVGSGLGLTGGPITGSGTLSINTAVVPQLNVANTFTANQQVNGTLTATSLAGNGANVTNVNASQLSGLAASSFAQLAASNTFTANQTVNGNLSATGVVTGSSYQIGSNLFDYGSAATHNAFLGFAGNTTTTGGYGDNTAAGYQAFFSNTSGSFNTASGWEALYSNTEGVTNSASGARALYSNTTGASNTASGLNALFYNTTGDSNTAAGSQAGYTVDGSNITGSGNSLFGSQTSLSTGTLDNATAIGANAVVGESNAVVLGGIGGLNGAGVNVNVGIGTSTPRSALDIDADVESGLGPTLTLSNNERSGTASQVSIDFNTYTPSTSGTYNPSARILVQDNGDWSDTLFLQTNTPGNSNNGLETLVTIGPGADNSGNPLAILKGQGSAISDGWTTYSSRRWKTNIQTLPDALAKVEQLRGVSYDLKDSGKHEIGVIAEEVGAVVPEVVTFEANGKDARGVDYTRLTALLIEATKEQQALIRKQQQQIRAQQAQIRSSAKLAQAQQAQIGELMSQVTAIRAALKTNGRRDAEVRTVRAQVSTLQ
jgi:hypothetical protein